MVRTRLAAVLAVALLVGTPLAGCMDGGPGGGGDGDGDTQLTTEESRARFQTAMRNVVDREQGLSSQISLNMTFSSETPNGTQRGFLDMYVNAESDELVFEMSGDSFGGSDQASQISSLVVAQMGKTIMLGEASQLWGTYNESAEPVESFDDLENGTVGDATSTPGSGSGNLLGIFEVLTNNVSEEVDSFSASSITHEGKDALEIESANPDDEAKPYLRAVLWLEPLRPAVIEGRVTQEAADASETIQQPGEFEMTFTYGDDATHPRRDALVRLETMTFSNGTVTPQPGAGSSGKWTNHTVQPSRDMGAVPLDEVTAHVVNRSFGGQEETVIEMPLEQGSASSDEARLTYEDADGDGEVSEGDEIRLEKLDENATLGLSLEDETTGMRLTPSATLLGVLAAAGAAAALVRGRRP